MNCIPQQEKWLRRFVLFVAAMVAFSLAGATAALAQCTDSWTGGGGNNAWSNGANWSTGKEPGQNDAACIQLSGAAVTFDVNDTIAGLALGTSDSLTVPSITNGSPNLNINGASIVNNGQIVFSPPVSFGGIAFTLSYNKTTTLSGTGAITLNTTSFGNDQIGGSALLLNQSTIQGAGGIGMTVNNASNGVINATDSQYQLVLGRNQGQGASTNTGLLEATGGGQMAIGSLTLNNVGGTIAANGTGSAVIFTNEGQGGQTITGGTFKTNGGVVYSGNSTLLDGTNGNTIANTGP